MHRAGWTTHTRGYICHVCVDIDIRRSNLQIGLHTFAKWSLNVARPVRKKTNWVFAVGRLTACDALAASLCGLVVRVGECGEVSKACAVQRAASAVVSSSPFVQQASLGSSSGGWMTPAAGWNLSRPHNGRQWLNRSVLTYSRGSEPLALRRRAQ